MHRAFLLAVLPLAACTTADAEAETVAPAYEAIAFDINTWGRPMGSWEVHADGRVRHLKVEGSVFGARTNERREFTVDGAAYARLAAIAAALPQPRPRRDDCVERAMDLPYGKLRLTRGGAEEAVDFDTGCRDRPYQAFVGQLRAMDDLVGEWAEQHPAASVEEVGRD
jgi:hypothetical protein